MLLHFINTLRVCGFEVNLWGGDLLDNAEHAHRPKQRISLMDLPV
jgi:hypothetical protein